MIQAGFSAEKDSDFVNRNARNALLKTATKLTEKRLHAATPVQPVTH